MEKIFKKYEIINYIIITFLFTWTFWGISLTSSNQMINGSFRIIGSFMPSVVAIIFTGFVYGREGIKNLLKKLMIWKVNPNFYAFAIFYTAATIFIPSFICTIIGLNYNTYFGNQLSGFQLTTPFAVFTCFLAVVFFGGPVGEEFGWRGFVLPKLQKKYNPILSSILLGCIWSCWHIPMFLAHAAGYDISFIRYLFETIWLTIIFTWLYNHTKQSLLIPILFHSVDNFVMALCYRDFMNYVNCYTVIWYMVKVMVLVWIVFDMIRRPLKQ